MWFQKVTFENVSITVSYHTVITNTLLTLHFVLWKVVSEVIVTINIIKCVDSISLYDCRPKIMYTLV